MIFSLTVHCGWKTVTDLSNAIAAQVIITVFIMR